MGELIVKYKNSVRESPYQLIKRGKPFREATSDESSSLDKLDEKYKVRWAIPVFRTLREESLIKGPKTVNALRRLQREQVSRVMRRFSERATRAPEGERLPDLSHIYVLKLSKKADIQAAAAEFSADRHVAYAHPNFLVEAQALPNDTYLDPDQDGVWSSGAWGQAYEDLWGLKRIQADAAWPQSEGQGVVVAVVDSGLDFEHPDIWANVWEKSDDPPGDIPDGCDRIADPTITLADDDCNRFVDDSRGWDFVNGDGDPTDDHGHGTHLSGTIAAVGNNAEGIIGVAPRARIMAVKSLNASAFGTSDQLAAGLRYAADNGADVINNSWGCAICPQMPVWEDAVRYAHSLGAVLVFGAGNSNDDVVLRSPQNQAETVVVSASNQDDKKTSFSSFGSKIDVAAPGGGGATGDDQVTLMPQRNILSLRARANNIYGERVGTDYLRWAGTSMAAPHVSGLAALILARHPEFTNEQVRQVLRMSADDIEAPGFDVESGYGRINAARALTVDSVPQVMISAPRSHANIGDLESLDVRGTAAGPDLVSYRLSYGVGISPTEWIPIGTSSVPVEDGVLGTWYVRSLERNYYTLKLEATDGWGMTYDFSVPVVKEQGVSQLSTASTYDRSPAVSGSKVVWEGYRNGNTDLYLHDLTTGAEQQITNDSASQSNPAISGGKVVWQDDRNGNLDIYL
ncbi:MAG: S8 family serine peptidase, partial [Solirubrobacterales bacterium]